MAWWQKLGKKAKRYPARPFHRLTYYFAVLCLLPLIADETVSGTVPPQYVLGVMTLLWFSLIGFNQLR